jgi:hypothetical protein
MLLEGVKQSSLPKMFWESVPSRGSGVGECPLAGGGQLGAGYPQQEERGSGIGKCPLASGGQLGAGYSQQEGISS